LHLEEKDFGICVGATGEDSVLNKFQDVLAEAVEFCLNFFLVLFEKFQILASL